MRRSTNLDRDTDAPPASNEPRIRPPLKWAGGKYQILNRIRERLPAGHRLVEPFVGSGAVFLNTHYDRYLLNDINTDLIGFYKALKKEGDAFIEYARQFFTDKTNRETVFYKLRNDFNATSDALYKAALFLYINKHGYNGLIRYNASGALNVPFGRYKRPYYPEKEMRVFLKKARKASFSNKDFKKIMLATKPGDVVYCDPPYVPLSRTANFTAYSAAGFGQQEQLRLAELAEELAGRGVPVLISNHYTDFTATAYQNAEQFRFPVRRLISCNGSKRKPTLEVLAAYY